MPAWGQYKRHIFELAEQRRQNGIQERMASVHEVWSQSGEQKVRVVLGIGPDGSTPYLSPWLHTGDHRGSHRTERKYHVGQNVIVSAVGGDMRQATVKHHAESTKHPRPANADDIRKSFQYASNFHEHGPAYHKHWLGQPQGSGAGVPTPSAVSAAVAPAPIEQAYVTLGSPTDPQNSGQPNQGPDPDQSGNVQPLHQTQIGSNTDPPNSQPARVTITPQMIVHELAQSAVTITKQNVTAMVGGGGGGIMPEQLQGLLGPITSSIVTALGQFINPSQIAAMSSAALGAVAGSVGAGAQISSSSIQDLDVEVENALASLAAEFMDDTMLSDLETAVVNEANMLIGDSFTVGSDSVSQIAADLVPVILGVVDDALDSDQINNAANMIAAIIIGQAVLNTSPVSVGNGYSGDPSDLSSSIMSAVVSSGGGSQALSSSGVSSSLLSSMMSDITSKLKNMTGGSVWSLVPGMISHRTQQNHNTKSAQNITNAAGQTLSQSANNINQTANEAHQTNVSNAIHYVQNDFVVSQVGDKARMTANENGVKIKFGDNVIFVNKAGCWSTLPMMVMDDNIPDGSPTQQADPVSV